jgi:hypothetical protein
MKWVNKRKTSGYDLDRVVAWFYANDALTLFFSAEKYGHTISNKEDAENLRSLLLQEYDIEQRTLLNEGD